MDGYWKERIKSHKGRESIASKYKLYIQLRKNLNVNLQKIKNS